MTTLFSYQVSPYPISDLELEQAAIAPRRWIEHWGAFEQHPSGFGEMLRPTRIIRGVAKPVHTNIFLVPGGRYLVVVANERLFVWDSGYVSNAYCMSIASVGLEDASRYDLSCMVQATQDGIGLIILVDNVIE